jgi:hypothetical protein
MNQLIIIGELHKYNKKDKNLELEIKTKDYKRSNISVKVLIEEGYQQDMLSALDKKPLLAIKVAFKNTKGKIGFIAEKMSVLKLGEEKETDEQKE